MKHIRKQIKNTFDRAPRKTKAETLDSLGIRPQRHVRPAVGRRAVLVAACIIALCALGTSFALAIDDPSIIDKLFEIIDRTESEDSSVSETSSAVTVNDPAFGAVILSAPPSLPSELPEPVTGTFDTLSQAMRAVETEYDFYYPTWDGGTVSSYGKDRTLLVLVGANGVVTPPNYEDTRYYLSLQFEYHTKQIDFFKVVLGRRESIPSQYDEAYTFEGGTFYLYEPTFEEYKGKVLAVATIGQCSYQILAHSAEDAKRMIDSLVMP